MLADLALFAVCIGLLALGSFADTKTVLADLAHHDGDDPDADFWAMVAVASNCGVLIILLYALFGGA